MAKNAINAHVREIQKTIRHVIAKGTCPACSRALKFATLPEACPACEGLYRIEGRLYYRELPPPAEKSLDTP